VRLAAEEAELRSNISSMFVNLSRRTQTLVERQISLIDGLEKSEEDSKRLADLFKLDHLATRMRRNSENLLVLAGHEPTRRRTQPAKLVDVVRASLSEVEDYERVQIKVHRTTSVVGSAANDIVHLIAELVENALQFSPRNTQVTVSSSLIEGGGALLSISDQGIGMTEEELAEANSKLAEPPVVDVSVSRRMGLFVVGRLALRHGIRVQLRQAEGNGLIAMVLIPPALIVESASKSPIAPAAGWQQSETPAQPAGGMGQRGGFEPFQPQGTPGGLFGAGADGLPRRTPSSFGQGGGDRGPAPAQPAASSAFGGASNDDSFHDPFSSQGGDPFSKVDPFNSHAADPFTSQSVDPFTSQGGDPFTSHGSDPFGGRPEPREAAGSFGGSDPRNPFADRSDPRGAGSPGGGPREVNAFGGSPDQQQNQSVFSRPDPSGPGAQQEDSGGFGRGEQRQDEPAAKPVDPFQPAVSARSAEQQPFSPWSSQDEDPITASMPAVEVSPLEAEEEYLPIFASVESAWFRKAEVLSAPEDAALAEAERAKKAESERLEEWESARAAVSGTGSGLPKRVVPNPEEWRTPADEGWRAAQAAAEPALGGITAAGLPKRTPKANLVPGRVGPAPGSGGAAASIPPISAERVRNRMASLQQGIRRGRAEVREGSARRADKEEG